MELSTRFNTEENYLTALYHTNLMSLLFLKRTYEIIFIGSNNALRK